MPGKWLKPVYDVRFFTYHAYNLLTGTSAGAVLQYDAENRLVLTNSPSSAQREFLYDGADLIAEYDGSGALVARYVHGPGVDNPLVWFVGTDDSTPRYLTTDQQGSVTDITDGSGNSIYTNTYNEYGLPASGNTGRFQYTGQVWLPEVGLLTTRPACMRQALAGSCNPTRSAMATG